MVQAVPASQITLPDLQDSFGLTRSDDEQFFLEWQTDLPELTAAEEQAIAEIKAEYRHLSQYSMLEPMVKMVVLSPLLKLAKFYQPPFYLAAEKEVAIASEDDGIVIRGRIDLLVFSPPFWVTVIESKQVAYSVETAIPQALAYMLSSPNGAQPAYGFVSNGPTFRFLKLQRQDTPVYGTSYMFALDRGDDLQQVVKILKQLAQTVIQAA